MSHSHTWRRTAMAAVAGAAMLFVAGAPSQAVAADNSGHVWVSNDTTGASTTNPSAQPHLVRSDIAVWGDGLSGSAGTFSLSSLAPSGDGSVVYTGSWSYSGSGSQVIAQIDLIQAIHAVAGETPQSQQGYHLQLSLDQDPGKTVTFWVAAG